MARPRKVIPDGEIIPDVVDRKKKRPTDSGTFNVSHGGDGKNSTLSSATVNEDALKKEYKKTFNAEPIKGSAEYFSTGKVNHMSNKEIEKSLGLPHKGKKKK